MEKLAFELLQKWYDAELNLIQNHCVDIEEETSELNKEYEDYKYKILAHYN